MYRVILEFENHSKVPYDMPAEDGSRLKGVSYKLIPNSDFPKVFLRVRSEDDYNSIVNALQNGNIPVCSLGDGNKVRFKDVLKK